MIIDSTYFHTELLIPQLRTLDSVGVEEVESSVTGLTISNFISKYESKFLIKLMGKELTDAFTKGLKADPVDEIWTHLKSLLVDEDLKISPIANYVYYWFKRNENSITTGLGEVKAEQSYAVNVSEANKSVRAYNEMCDLINVFYSSIDWSIYKKYYGKMTGFDLDLSKKINMFNL